MTVESIESGILDSILSQYTTTSTEDTESETMMMEDFLSIFLTQLQYQDPLNPMESSDMTAQMAQITMVEQQYNTNEALETIAQTLNAQQNNQFLNYIGKEVMIEGNAATVKDGEVLGGVFYTEEYADVEVVIYDTDGNEIKRIYLGELESGEHEIAWDGTDSDGEIVDDGAYVYDVIATNVLGNSATVQTTYSGVVTGITYDEDGTVYLVSGDWLIEPDAVLKISATTVGEAASEDVEAAG